MSLNCCCGSCYGNNERPCCFDWSKLPDDLTVQILCHLPEKPLIQFKCVSKAWYFLISNVCVPRVFAFMPLSGFLFRWMAPDYKYTMDYAPLDDNGGEGFVESYSMLLPFPHTGKDVLDCCNGLLLVVNRSSVPVEYYVCNPATKQCVPIPVSPMHLKFMYAKLAFNPLKSTNYKIVHLARSAAIASVTHPPELDVFSSDTGKWVKHLVLLEPELYGFKWIAHSVYLDGVLYLLSCAMYLLFFNLKADNLNAQAIKLPEIVRPGKFPVDRTTILRGFLGASKEFLYYANHIESAVLVWSLEQGCCKGGQWILKHNICVDDLAPHSQGRIFSSCYPLLRLMPYALHPTSDVIFLGIPSMLFSYHLKTNQFKVIHKLEYGRAIIDGQYCVFPYSRCLLALHNFTQRNILDRSPLGSELVMSSRYSTNYKELKELGKGSFGTVFLCKNLLDNKNYAVRKIPIKDGLDGHREKVLREVLALSTMDHRHVVRYVQAWIEDGYTVKQYSSEEESTSEDSVKANTTLYIQMKFCPRTLDGLLESCRDSNTVLDKRRVWRYFRQIVEGVHHIHKQSFVHQNLSRFNIFVDENENILIGDFGLATFPQDRSCGVAIIGDADNILYMAPELKEKDAQVVVSDKADIFSIGLLLCDLLYQFATDGERISVFGELRMGKFPESAEPILKDLLASTPLARPSTSEILRRPLPWGEVGLDYDYVRQLGGDMRTLHLDYNYVRHLEDNVRTLQPQVDEATVVIERLENLLFPRPLE
ncbi:hypothetical protein RHMOL_Rhmol11G0215400 [Rhododendron molle]|uniref:Uncharacterized protein n=1 Tax=Rhododendron molle TaxID=49168 RepID=A0ACC0LUX9_RHOML|nr:hypothetical protein RHMOL_Rhmol11G0215400 [Rhododendron molle]